MFIREKHRKNKDGSVTTYLQLVESRRVDGRSRQKVLSTLGRKDDPRLGKHLSGLVETAARYARLTTLLLEQGMTVKTQVWGPELVWRRLWEETVGPIVEEALGGGRLCPDFETARDRRRNKRALGSGWGVAWHHTSPSGGGQAIFSSLRGEAILKMRKTGRREAGISSLIR